MRLKILLAFTVVAGLTACAQAASPVPVPKTDEEEALYSLGVATGRDLQGFTLTPQELEMVKAGFTDGIRDTGKLKPDEMTAVLPKLQELYKTRMEANAKKEKEAGAAYLVKAAAEKGATKTASGLVYRELTAGTGAAPKPEDVVKVNYEGKFPSGKVFDSSIERKEPATFPLNGVIPCWTEGVGMMKVGGKAQIVCPPELAYGAEGRPPQMPGGATLVFEVELLSIEQPQAAAGAPPAAPAK
jgi:FKBP-type peptidyl-prolyl cis-trans isomerase FkpA